MVVKKIRLSGLLSTAANHKTIIVTPKLKFEVFISESVYIFLFYHK